MEFSLGLTQNQSLQQRMQLTAQMIHGLDLLQLPIMELSAQINQELVENPVLEIEESTESEFSPEESGIIELDTTASPVEDVPEPPKEFDKYDDTSDSYDEHFKKLSVRDSDEFSKMDAMENTAKPTGSLQDHLMEQFSFTDVSEREKELVEHLIYRINPDGFLEDNIDEIVNSNPIEATKEEWLNAIEILRKLEPIGIGAFSIEESLLLQLKNQGHEFPLLEKIIKDHFQSVLHNRIPKVAKELGVSIEAVKNAIKALRFLNPKPGAQYSIRDNNFITPDVIIDEIEGEMIIRVSAGGIPKLGVSSYYAEMLDSNVDAKAEKYIKNKLSAAHKIIESIDKRKDTLYKISTELIKTQKDFFEKGVDGLKPLMMQDVAEKVGVHVSTVCRTVANKYVESPKGIFPLKFFFVNSSGGVNGGENSTTQAVLQKIKTMINQEDKRKPLSDQVIVDTLKRDGLSLARRTITKYREQLGIPSSVKRKSH